MLLNVGVQVGKIILRGDADFVGVAQGVAVGSAV